MFSIIKQLQFVVVFALLASVAAAGCSSGNARAVEGVFTNQTGQQIRLKDFKGKVVLMNFIFTSCPNKGCDLLSLQLLRVQNHLRDRIGKDLFLLSVTMDPKKDTPEVLKNFASRYKADPEGWYFLTADKRTTNRLMEQYNATWMTYSDGSLHHKVVIALLDKNGNKVAVYDNSEKNAEKIVEDITKLLDGNN